MEQLNALWQHLSGFPLWQESVLTVDTTPAEPEAVGLFPQGIEVLDRKQDVLGNCRLRLRQSFLLRRRGLRTRESAAWLMELQSWAVEASPKALEPLFGKQLHLRLEKGRLLEGKQPGTALYEGIIIMEYTKENRINED